MKGYNLIELLKEHGDTIILVKVKTNTENSHLSQYVDFTLYEDEGKIIIVPKNK